MKTYGDYSDYFENLATQHVDIPHGVNGKKAFTRVNIEETITGFRTQIAEKSIMMILTNYLYRVLEGGADDQMKAIDMSFFIVGYFKNADFDHETEVKNKCEKIADDIINRIKWESKNVAPDKESFWYNSLSKLNDIVVNPVSNIGDLNNVGYQVSLSFHIPFNNCVDVNAWADLNAGNFSNDNKNWTT